MHLLETRVPPPVVMALLGFLAWLAARFLPTPGFGLPASWLIGGALIASGLALNALPKFAFRRVGTTVNPMKPGATTRLVTSGIYRYTRNPMYLGHSVILLGWSACLENAAALLAAPAYMLYISHFQIRPEERQLSARFPEAFATFCRQVPRWL